jgi:hypothetical protein
MPQNEAGRGALCFPGVYGNPLISLNVDFPPGVSPRFPGVLEPIDSIENQNPHPGPRTPMHFAPSCERGASAKRGRGQPARYVHRNITKPVPRGSKRGRPHHDA